MTKPSLKNIYQPFAFAFAAMLITLSPAHAQIQSVDPNDVIEGAAGNVSDAASDAARDAAENGPATLPDPSDLPSDAGVTGEGSTDGGASGDAATTGGDTPIPGKNENGANQATYQEDDLIGAAEGLFGKGAEGIGKLIRNILKDQGQPNGYIVGREAGGAFVVGLRYGSGTLSHKVEGEMPVYWTGPSVGFDAGGNAGSTFVLVYNLYDTEDLFKRFASAEGVAYLVGGFNAAYLRRGDVVLIPIRVGAGLRLGANVGYMKLSKKRRWLPF